VSDVFVGRRGVLEQLSARLDEAFEGRGAVVMVVGELGIGKTAIARELTARARQRGATVLAGACFEGDWQPAYAPWVQALSPYLERSGLAGLLGASAAPLPPDEARLRLFDAVSRLLAAIADAGPVVLVLDDLHWADPDTLRLLRYVARATRELPVLIVGAYRDPDTGDQGVRLAGELRREAALERIGLRGFTVEEVGDYLAAVALRPMASRLARAIHEETAGNPFYVGEVLHQLADGGKLVDDAGSWSLRDLGVPPGVREILAVRMARLSADAGRVLTAASALSGGFGLGLLRALTGLAEEDLLDAIDELLRAGLIRTVGERGYDFAHAIVRHTLADGLNPDRRARLHRRIAETLEQLGGPGRAAELGYQYHASRALPGAERGIVHCRAAAEDAARAYAPDRASRFLRMAADLSADAQPAERADLLRALAVAQAEALLLEDAAASVQAALAAMATAGADPAATGEFLARVARTLKDGGADRSAWEPLVENGLAASGDRRDLTWARLTLLLDRFEVVATGPVRASRLLAHEPEAVAIARRAGDEDDYALTLEPLHCRTADETDEVLRLARTWRQPAAVLRALDIAARDQLHRHGAFWQARTTLEELLAVSERYGSIPAQAEALVQLSAAHAALGDLALARESEQRARELVARLGPQHRLHVILDLVVASLLAYLTEGDWPELGARAAQLSAEPETGRTPLGPAWASLAVVNLSRAGAGTECRRLLGALTPVLQRLGPAGFRQAPCVCRAGDAVWELSATEYAAAYRRLALDLVAAGMADAASGSAVLTVARMAALQGEHAEAGRWFERARIALEADGRRPLRAIVDYDEALALLRAGSRDTTRIAELRQAALDAIRALGMESWERRAQRLLPRGEPKLPDRLTAREAEVLGLVAGGMTNKQIAAELVLSPTTVERHVANVYRKIGAHRRAEAATYAVVHGLARPEIHGFRDDGRRAPA
jgi:ATP/maltotriose-dependent transcriptional regulator MalT